MAFCANCGAQASGGFCPNCGSPISSSVPPPNAPAQATNAGGLSDNVAGALCYLFGLITGIIFLVLAPYNQNKFVRFHAFQSIFIHIGFIVLFVCLSILGLLTHGLTLLLYPLVMLAGFALWLYMLYSAYNNQKVKLPIVGDLAEKQA